MVIEADKEHYAPVEAYRFRGGKRKFYDKPEYTTAYRTSDGEIYYPAGDSEGYFVAT
jgi:hypothetical protein